MIKQYNYSNIIKPSDERIALNFIDQLFKSGNWCNREGTPKYQTWENLYQYKEIEIFKETFVESCFNYLNFKYDYKIKMWCFRDNIFTNRMKSDKKLWHKHGEINEKKISGVYYLKNLRKEGTEFKDFVLNVDSYTWYIFPSYLEHRPPRIKSFRNRYTIAADFLY